MKVDDKVDSDHHPWRSGKRKRRKKKRKKKENVEGKVRRGGAREEVNWEKNRKGWRAG